MRAYWLIANYQYSDGTVSYTHWQIGGNCLLPGGIGWKAAGTRSEAVMSLQAHNETDSSFTFRSGIGATSRELEIKPSFNLSISGLGFIEFVLKRFL